MAANILKRREWEYFIDEMILIPTGGGRFEFEANGDLLFSKKQLGRHAEPGEIEGLFADFLAEYAAAEGVEIPVVED